MTQGATEETSRLHRAQAPAKLCAAFSGSLPQVELADLVRRMAGAYGLPPGQLSVNSDLPMGAVAAPPGCLVRSYASTGEPTVLAAWAGDIQRPSPAAPALPWLDHDQPVTPAMAKVALQGLYGTYSLVLAGLGRPWALLANDRLGFGPLFYLLCDDLLLAASEVKAIAAVADVHPDPAGYAQFFYVGYLLRHQTLLREVKALGPGQWIEWQPTGGHVHTYHDLARSPAVGTDPAPLDAINDALQQAVASAARCDARETLLLSGGLDSRLILGVLLSQGHKPPALTLEHTGFARGLDGQLAREVAEIAGLEQDFRPTRPDFYRSADALEVFQIADGMTPSFGLFISQVYPELTPALGRVWEGLALDLCLGGQVQTGSSLRSNLPELLASRPTNRHHLQHFLQREWFQQMEAGFAETLESEVARFPDTEDGWIRFQMANRKRRRVGIPPHHLYSRKVVALTPGTDARFVDFMWSLPIQQRRHNRLVADLLLRYYPQLTGPPVLSGEYRGQVAQIARSGTRHSGGLGGKLRLWAKKLGLAPYLRAGQARLGKIERARRDAVPAEIITQTLRVTGFQQPIYNRPTIEQALAKAEEGSLHWLSALIPIFYMELWRCLSDPAALAALRRSVFAG